MPTNYNFSKTPDYAELAFPNLSPAKRIIEHVNLDGQTNYYTYVVDSTEKSPNNTDSVKFTITSAPGGSFFLLADPSNQSLLPPKYGRFISSVPRSFIISLWIKGNTAGTVVFDFRLQAGGAGSGTANRTLTSSWQYHEITVNMTSTIAVGNFAVPGILLTTPPVNGDIIWLADFQFRDPLDTAETTSFDDQFIPADTFRQGNLLTWGNTAQSGNPSRNLTIGARVPYNVFYSSPLVIQTSTNNSWKHVSQWSKNLSVALDGNGKAWYWGYAQGFPNITTAASIIASTPVLSNSDYTWITMQTQSYDGSTSPIKSFGAGIRVDGTLWTWGENNYGQLGIGVTTSTLTLVQEFTSSSNWKSLSLSETAIHAIKSDGTLWCWGRNDRGRLATNDLVDRWTPTQEFTSSSNWKYVDGGTDAICAIKTDGTLWGWGGSINGVGADEGLPSGTATKSRPFRENTLSTNWKTVNVGGDSTLGDAIVALKTDGTAWAWGIYASGNSSGSNRATPTSIANEPGLKWKDISGGYEQVFLISTDSSLWGFGANQYFNLTNSDNNFRATPIPIFNISKVKRVEVYPGFFTSSNVRVLTYIDPVI